MATERSVTVRLRADIGDFNAKLLAAGAAAKGFTSELDSSSTRMSNMIQTAVALGPALIPVLGGAAVGAAALGASLTFAATGAGVAALALNGVGDALDALNKFNENPTTASLAALQAKLDELAPAGQNFVFFLENLKPKLDALKATAEGGFLPGLQEGIESVMQSAPAINTLIGNLASTLGDLATEAGDAFQSPFWQGFLKDFTSNASTELAKFAEGIGNVTTGLAGMFEAFLPVSTDFTAELLKMSQSFSEWGQNLSTNQGFQDFISYIRDNGPNAAAALASIADAFISIVKAGAPVGSAVLPVITAMAQALSAVAESPAGPVIFGIAAAVSALARAFAVMKALNSTALVSGVAALGGSSMTMAAARTQLLAGSIAALALSLTDLDDKAGVSNSLMGGALGFAIGGGWGAAIGAAIGLTKDLASANDDLEDSMGDAAASFDSQAGNLQADSKALQDLIKARSDYQKSLSGNGVSFWSVDPHDVGDQLTSTVTHISDFFTNTSHESSVAVEDFTTKLDALKSGWTEFANDVGGDKSNISQIADILKTLGYSVADVNSLIEHQSDSVPNAIAWQTAVHAVQDYMAAQDSVPGRTKEVNDAIAGLDDKLLSTADAASAVKDAMDALFGPELTLSAATDQWAQDLADLKDNLDENSKSLTGQTDAARTNRGAIRDLVTDLTDVANAGAGVGETSGQFNSRLQSMYQNLLDTGKAAGLSKTQLQDYLATLNLTPKEIKTLVKLFGSENAQKQTQDLVNKYNALPLSLRTDIATNGWPTTMAQVKALQDRYNLTPKQVQTLLAAIDHASGPISGVKASLSDLDGRHADVSINVTHTDTQVIQRVYQQLGDAYGITGADGMVLDFYANGGIRKENHVAQIAPAGSWRIWAEDETGGEAYIPLAPAKRERSRSIADETVNRLGGVVQWLADGGIGQRGGYASSVSLPGVSDMSRELANLRAEVHELRTGTQKVHAVNADEIATGVRAVADDSVAQNQAHRETMAGMYA